MRKYFDTKLYFLFYFHRLQLPVLKIRIAFCSLELPIDWRKKLLIKTPEMNDIQIERSILKSMYKINDMKMLQKMKRSRRQDYHMQTFKIDQFQFIEH